MIIIIIILIHDHPFLFFPYDISYCWFQLYNHSILFSCENAFYQSYGLTFTLTNLIFIQNIGLNNIILPMLIMSTNIVLIVGLRRRTHQRRHRLGKRKSDDWRERSVVLYMLLSSIAFLFLTAPVGILGAWAAVHKQKVPTNNLALLLDLMEIIHHCSHFPILLMTSSVIRTKAYQILFHPHTSRQNSLTARQTPQPQRTKGQSSNQHGVDIPPSRFAMASISRTS